jgi:hypothetical protein
MLYAHPNKPKAVPPYEKGCGHVHSKWDDYIISAKDIYKIADWMTANVKELREVEIDLDEANSACVGNLNLMNEVFFGGYPVLSLYGQGGRRVGFLLHELSHLVSIKHDFEFEYMHMNLIRIFENNVEEILA